MPLPFVEKMDMLLRLFDGDVGLSELVSLDLPSQRALVQARIENLKKSQKAYEEGRIDAYSRRYAASMGMGGPSTMNGDNTSYLSDVSSN